MYREYGYAPRGQKVYGQISGRKYKRCGIVAAKMGDKILAPFQYSGTMNSTLFEHWFTQQLPPSLEKGTVIVMDNASFHSKQRLISAAQNAGCKLLFLPPYSPDLNPVEKFWAWLKRFLRKIFLSVVSFNDISSVVATDSCPITLDSVLTSMPCSGQLAQKVCSHDIIATTHLSHMHGIAARDR